MKKRRQLKLDKVWGLVLAVSFLVVSSVQADVFRATDTSFLGENQVLMEVFTFTYDGTAVGNGVAAAEWVITPGELFASFDGFGYDQTTKTLRGGGIESILETWFESMPYSTFVGYWSDDTSVLNVNGDDVGGVGNWFYNLVFDYGAFDDALAVNFGNVPVYTFVLYAVVPVSETIVPEPATMAVVGLGLVGLGLARRRRRK